MASCAASTERVGAPHALYADLQRAHPLDGPTFDGGVVVNVSDVGEAGASNVDGNLHPGEKIQVTFTIEDDAGAAIAPSAVSNLSPWSAARLRTTTRGSTSARCESGC